MSWRWNSTASSAGRKPSRPPGCTWQNGMYDDPRNRNSIDPVARSIKDRVSDSPCTRLDLGPADRAVYSSSRSWVSRRSL
jgi:hypothetical protein